MTLAPFTCLNGVVLLCFELDSKFISALIHKKCIEPYIILKINIVFNKISHNSVYFPNKIIKYFIYLAELVFNY